MKKSATAAIRSIKISILSRELEPRGCYSETKHLLKSAFQTPMREAFGAVFEDRTVALSTIIPSKVILIRLVK